MTNETSQGQENVQAESAQVAPAAEPVVNTQPAEKVVPQSTVNEIVGNAKRDSYERGRREGINEVSATQVTQQPKAESPKSAISEDRLRQLIDEEAQKRADQKAAETVVQSFISKVNAGKGTYSDFDDKVATLDIPNLPPQLIHYANNVDNTADVLYELAKNPSKFATVVSLSVVNGTLAQKTLNDISASIKQNQTAAKQAEENDVPEPLDQMKPSTTGTDNGNMSVKDYMNQPWLRG